ncbi:MAG: dinitrogenase iron-molybdenum cofactor biosynthesis protein [Caldilineae bacterium]|nr:dinitrogenase iron-molybdenum cofactor biosynthesis protein [Anaerolineae bacterium]MCB0204173.1 dinitrogenase iron-molybdenum cofactor biosynthesis protein [Anaerolineae bacterium]MCB0253164.1 dinitrogenase iron-molybdenum cofactor biosynthesis protein [Anaerolineae bacterium]MCB9152990.1 dinitrogenase iron-molybdenum cofactor biosynthesis protein [Caldilineae bacterium]
MKIAVVTDDLVTISRHFGRARNYLVLTVESGQVVRQEARPKAGHDQFRLHEHDDHDHDHDHEHGHGMGKHSQEKHNLMMANLADCQVLIAGGMGQGAWNSLVQLGIKPVMTNEKQIAVAVREYLDGELVEQPKLVH